jgi:pimeloyl-ACP methyl ester carboxylesterase
VIEPPATATMPPRAALIFLHGYAGSFTLECWLVARAAEAIGAVTVCPAVGFAGHWSGRDGARTLRATLAYLRGRGVARIYLAGLSNGAVGASALAPRFAAELAGLILISGAPARGGAGGLPALVVHGERDTMASAGHARQFAARNGARYAGFDAGHFVLLMRRDETRAAIAAWLRGRSP